MNEPLVTLITPTGNRPEAFDFCQRQMMRQTYKGLIQWLIINDCPDETVKIIIPTDSNIIPEVLKGPLAWRPGINTQRPNLTEALGHIKGDIVIGSIEDDDWYSPNFLTAYVNLLKIYPVVGEGNSTYYNLKSRSWKQWRNYQHCSLCQTGFRKELLPRFEEAIHSGELFMDMALWNIFHAHKLKPFIFLGQNYTIGIKAMPGRLGIGSGHFPDESFVSDPGFNKLKELVGADADFYIKISRGNQELEKPKVAPVFTNQLSSSTAPKQEEAPAAPVKPILTKTGKNISWVTKYTKKV